MRPRPRDEYRGAAAYARARAWDPSELLDVMLHDAELNDAALSG